jgi:hypothetical protein
VCNVEWKSVLIASLAFGLYVICPRMSAMIVQQAKVKGLNLSAIIVLGALISIPLFVTLSHITIRLGTGWAILFAAAGDVAAAALLGVIEPKTGVEPATITVFVYVGIRVAPAISSLVFR